TCLARTGRHSDIMAVAKQVLQSNFLVNPSIPMPTPTHWELSCTGYLQVTGCIQVTLMKKLSSNIFMLPSRPSVNGAATCLQAWTVLLLVPWQKSQRSVFVNQRSLPMPTTSSLPPMIQFAHRSSFPHPP